MDFKIFMKFERFNGLQLRFYALKLTKPLKICKTTQIQEQIFEFVFTKSKARPKSKLVYSKLVQIVQPSNSRSNFKIGLPS